MLLGDFVNRDCRFGLHWGQRLRARRCGVSVCIDRVSRPGVTNVRVLSSACGFTIFITRSSTKRCVITMCTQRGRISRRALARRWPVNHGLVSGFLTSQTLLRAMDHLSRSRHALRLDGAQSVGVRAALRAQRRTRLARIHAEARRLFQLVATRNGRGARAIAEAARDTGFRHCPAAQHARAGTDSVSARFAARHRIWIGASDRDLCALHSRSRLSPWSATALSTTASKWTRAAASQR
jgi:hypothetical protein